MNDLLDAPVHFERVVELAVINAAKILDRVKPGWANRINVNTLNMGSLDSCILDQIYGGQKSDGFMRSGYSVGTEKLLGEWYPIGVFCVTVSKDFWVKEIANRVCA